MAKCDWCGKNDPYNSMEWTTKKGTFMNNVLEQKFCSRRCLTAYEQSGYRMSEIKKGNGNCFVATAVYNNYDHPVVIDLRMFRDEFLIKKKWGQSFVRWYYMQGPKLAKFISKNNLRLIIAKFFIIKPLHIIARFIVKSKIHD